MRVSRMTAGAWAVLATIWLVAAPYANAQLISSVESKCAATLGKSSAKTAKTVAKETAKCRDADISGKAVGACPNAANQTKIDSSKAKLSSSALKQCISTCSVSGLDCVTDLLCPPLPNNNPPAGELCTAGADNKPFDYREIGFPGALCESILGGQILTGTDIGTCVAEVTEQGGGDLIDVVYGSINNASAINANAQACVKSLSKAAIKLSGTIHKGVVKCRDNISTEKTSGNPATCTTDDAKLAEKVAKAEDKLEAAITNCGNASIQALDICLQGPGAVTNVADAIACLVPAVRQVTDSTLSVDDRLYAPTTLVEAAYPPQPACGDNVVNQVANNFMLLGEECDGTDDSLCPGACLPPGDVFQCTCAGLQKRQRFLADGLTADLDSGWTGTSHNSGVTDKAGFVTVLSGCDCSAMTGSTCTGVSGDPICNVNGNQQPTCSWEPLGATRCEARGTDPNGTDDDADCFICDEFASNSGDFCVNEGDCTGQCYPIAGGAATTPCANGQGDCASGEICRGQCDRSQTCIIIPNGAPLPISSGGTAVCLLTTFRFDITGTHNIVTGEHALNIQQFSKTHLGVSNTVPCPTCGGFCDGGIFLDGDVCEGTCTNSVCLGGGNSGLTCDEDADCPAGVCQSGTLACTGGANAGDPCTVETEVGDCPASECTSTLRVCEGGANVGNACLADANCPLSTCSTLQCRFDSDCIAGETCTSASPQCPGAGGFCNLSLACNGGLNDGAPCRISAPTDLFGTTSADCQPSPPLNISGAGLEINFLPQTSEAVTLPPTMPCTAPGFELFDCPCPDAGGRKTISSLCGFACDAGAEFGIGCGSGAGALSGFGTTCDIGVNAGDACDEDSDCPGGTCSDNPTHCSGDLAFDRFPCDDNADCGAGTCVDACPSGRCLPLCLNADNAFFPPGFGGESADDPEEGLCAAGPSTFHCSGATDTFRICDSTIAAETCAATCSISTNPCSPAAPCPFGEGDCEGDCEVATLCEAGIDGELGNADDFPGAGICVADARNCFVQPIVSEGGDTLNGNGDPTNVRAVSTYCIPDTSNSAINSTAGLGGPGRLRQNGVNVTNGFTTLP